MINSSHRGLALTFYFSPRERRLDDVEYPAVIHAFISDISTKYNEIRF